MAKEKWSELVQNWSRITFPSRPSGEHVCFAETIIGTRYVDPTIAILGATPEWRTLTQSLPNAKVFVLDKNPEMVKAMTSLVKGYKEEEVVIGDWLDTLPCFEGQFDVILSDLTIGNIPYDLHREFYGLVSAALKKGGIFIDRILRFIDYYSFHKCDDLFFRFAEMELTNNTVNDFFCRWLFASEYLIEPQVVDTTALYRRIEQDYGTGTILTFLEESKKIMPEGLQWYYGRLWDDIVENYLDKRHIIEDLYDPADTPYEKCAVTLVTELI